MAFELSRKKLIRTFSYGRKRFVDRRSLEALPDRLEIGEKGAVER